MEVFDTPHKFTHVCNYFKISVTGAHGAVSANERPLCAHLAAICLVNLHLVPPEQSNA